MAPPPYTGQEFFLLPYSLDFSWWSTESIKCPIPPFSREVCGLYIKGGATCTLLNVPELGPSTTVSAIMTLIHHSGTRLRLFSERSAFYFLVLVEGPFLCPQKVITILTLWACLWIMVLPSLLSHSGMTLICPCTWDSPEDPLRHWLLLPSQFLTH